MGYNLGNFLRRLALLRSAKHWSLTTLREKLIKIGAKVVTHSRYVVFQMAEVAAPHELFAAVLERIQWLGVPPPRAQCGWPPRSNEKTEDRQGRTWRRAETGRALVPAAAGARLARSSERTCTIDGVTGRFGLT